MKKLTIFLTFALIGGLACADESALKDMELSVLKGVVNVIRDGETIPVEARLLGVADAFDAMTSHRPYRRALTVERALAEVKRCAGTQFDPELARAFVDAWECGETLLCEHEVSGASPLLLTADAAAIETINGGDYEEDLFVRAFNEGLPDQPDT